MNRLRWLVLPLALTMAVPRPAEPQEAQSLGQPRALLLAFAGALTLGGIASLAESGHEGAFCADRSCLMAVGGTAGAVIGYLLGRDLDARAARRRVDAPVLDPPLRSAGLPWSHRLSDHPEGIAALGEDRVLLVTPTLSTRDLLVGGGARAAVVLPARSLLILAGDTHLLALGLSGGTADTIEASAATALSVIGAGGLAVGERGALRRFEVAETASGGGVEARARAALDGVPQALAALPGNDVLVVVVDTLLETRSAGSLERLAALPLGAYGSDLSLVGGMAMVALGRAGLAVVDVRDPGHPDEVARLTKMNVAHAVAVAGQEAYVAAGAQGVFVYDLSQPRSPRLVGVIPDLGLATDVASSGGALWVLDRTGRRVIRIEGAGGLAARAAAGGGG